MSAADQIQVAPPVPPMPNNAKRNRILLIIGGIFSLIGVAFILQWAVVGRYIEETDNAYVQGNVVQVSAQVSGTVSRILVDDTSVVKAGQTLLTLDTADADVALAQADAQLAQTVREVRTLYAAQGQASANLALRDAELARARDDLSRRTSLAGTGAVSAEELRHAEDAVKLAKAALTGAQEQLESGRALTSGTTVSSHPNVARAVAKIDEIMLAQNRATIVAAVGGEIAKRNVQVGQRINPGAPLMAIVPLEQVWVDANFKESQLATMRIGQAVTLNADLYGSKVKFNGSVVGMGAGTGAAFALLPAQNATGNWIKVVQRIPVRIALDPKDLAQHPLRVGLSMHVEVDLHDQRGAAIGENHRPETALTAFTADRGTTLARSKAHVDAIIANNLR